MHEQHQRGRITLRADRSNIEWLLRVAGYHLKQVGPRTRSVALYSGANDEWVFRILWRWWEGSTVITVRPTTHSVGMDDDWDRFTCPQMWMLGSLLEYAADTLHDNGRRVRFMTLSQHEDTGWWQLSLYYEVED